MKKLLLSLILALLLAGQASSQTITVHLSGTVTRDSTGIPVENHQVIIQADSNVYGFNFYATRNTGIHGLYDCTIQNVPATGAAVTFIVKTKNCDSTFLIQTFVGTSTPVTIDFALCNGNPTACEAAFQSEADTSGLIHFFDTSYPNGEVISWAWDFGDPASGVNNVSTTQNPVHLFTAMGTYVVCLDIATASGCSSHRCHEILVGSPPTCEAAFHHINDDYITGMVHFFDSSYTQGEVVSWQWDFGDGTPGSNLQNPDHIYFHEGLPYNACLTIVTNDGCTSHRCQVVVPGSGTGCHALYYYYADSLNLLNLHFYDNSTPANMISSRLWSFCDGGTSTTYDPWHSYNVPGIYNVCLRITTTDSCTSEKCDEIHVGVNPANCESWFTYDAAFLTVHFEGHTNSQFATDYTWYIGEPVVTTLTGLNPSYTFPAQGSYLVTLVTHDSAGCEFSTSQQVYVHATCDIHGTVHAGNGVIDHGIVELIRVEGGAMTVADTKEVNDTIGTYWFGGVLPGHYYLRATLLPSSSLFGQYVPTYHVSSANWTNATLLELGQPYNPYPIEMVHALNYNAGSGTISGVVSQNAKINSGGSPVSDVEVLLLSTSNEPLSYTTSDQEGRFEFSNVGFGSYLIYPEIAGKNTTPSAVTLSSATPSATTSFTIQGNNILGIHNSGPVGVAGVSEIFPNPSVDKAYITINSNQESAVSVAVYFITGQLAGEFQFTLVKGTNQLTIPVKNLANSLYYVSIKDDRGSAVIRKMVIRK